jgi:uncharacterized OsmC-like protein
MFRIGGVAVRYKMKVPAAKRAEVNRALEIHQMYCPVHQSIQKGFEVGVTADIEEI